MNQPVKFGIVGVGGFGRTRRKTLRDAGEFEIVGGVDVREEAFVQADQDESKTLKRYPSVEALVADPQIAAVFVATPAQWHVPQAMIAARAGKAVFVEKPLGHDLAACIELVKYCEKHNVPHGHGFSSRYSPLWQHVRTMLTNGTLGRVVSVSAATMHTGGLAFQGDNWRFRANENPGGPLFQCGIHKIDLLRYLFGDGRWLAGTVNFHHLRQAVGLAGGTGRLPPCRRLLFHRDDDAPHDDLLAEDKEDEGWDRGDQKRREHHPLGAALLQLI